MSRLAIRIEGLGKRYQIGSAAAAHDRLAEQISEIVKAPFKRAVRLMRGQAAAAADLEDTIWALRDVSLEVKHGEVIGLIGRNGAGKSTLLKILSRITGPTEGMARLEGRVGSLLEVGTGFHPELTGRENIFLSGAILGMKRDEIKRKFDEIVAFSEIEQFIDTPVKHYSSGMYVRLAFAVAANLEPEILLIDEVLAVGDAAFQKKCLGKMERTARAGRTVVFVSHNMGAIHSLTEKCAYLEKGRLVAYGETTPIVQQYLEDSIAMRNVGVESLDSYRRDETYDVVRIRRIWTNQIQDRLPIIDMGDDITVYLELEVKKRIRGAHVDLTIKDRRGNRAVLLYSGDTGFGLSCDPGKYVIAVAVRQLPLAPGLYFSDFGINQSTSSQAYEVILDYPLFEVTARGKLVDWLDRPWGSVHWEGIEWAIRPEPGRDE